MRRDLICSLILAVLAAAYFAMARELDTTDLADSIGAAGLPTIYAAILCVLAVLLGLAAWLLPSRESSEAAQREEVSIFRQSLRAGGFVAIGAGYLVLVPAIGYPFAVALAIAAVAAYQGEPLSLRLALIAVLGAAALFTLFDLVLGIPMPLPWRA